MYIWVRVPLIVEVKVIIPQQYASVQPLEITNEVTVIGWLGVGLVVGDGLGVGLVVVGIELVVFCMVKRSKIIRITATVNIETMIIRLVLLGLDSDIFIIALTVRKLKFFSDKTNDKPRQRGGGQNGYNLLF